jgi:hypothetical protein
VVSWEHPLPEGRNGIITRYAVRILNVETGDTSLIFTNQLSLQLPTATFDVLPYRSYTLQVAAETVAGRGPYSVDTTAQTPEDSKL